MQTWVVANQKGSVGKTTTVVSMGSLLALRGHRVLLVDLDSRGSLTAHFGRASNTNSGSAYELFTESSDPAGLISVTRFDNIWILPSTPALATLDRQLGTQTGKGMVLRQALARLGDRFDFVLVDCSPTLGILMINALASGQLVVMPVQTEPLALKGLERMLVTLAMVNKARAVPILNIIVPTMFDRRTRASREALAYLQDRHGKDLWELVIPVDTQFRDASKASEPLPLMQRAARGSLAYESLVDTLLEMTSSSEIALARKVQFGWQD